MIILCGICGGIAAYKTIEVVSQLHKLGHEVHVVMSSGSEEFIKPLSFQGVSGHNVITNAFPQPDAVSQNQIYPHLYPATTADIFILLPATADMLAKIVTGYADDVVAASCLALPEKCQKFFCPAMNSGMWEQNIVQQNVAELENRGWQRIGPESGLLACGTEGEGRMTEPAEIVSVITAAIHKQNELKGHNVLILSGATREYLDSVRFIGNASSGKMGKSLAMEALTRGANVTFITGPVSENNLPRGQHLKIQQVVSAEEMLEQAKTHAPDAAIIIFAAAVSDYAPNKTKSSKKPKSKEPFRLELIPTSDIAATICSQKQAHQVALGFALEDQAGQESAKHKLQHKNLDGIILNTLDSLGAESGTFSYLAKGQNDFSAWGILSKRSCAVRIIDEALSLKNQKFAAGVVDH